VVAIVVVDEKWGIGCRGQLMFDIPEDMKHFLDITSGKVVVMGHSTLRSLPGGKPLKGRVNIVLSRNERLTVKSATVCNSVAQLLDVVCAYKPEDVIVIGGEEIYTRLLDYCSVVYLTKVGALRQSDTFFPNIDRMDNWAVESQSDQREHGGLKYRFYKYINTNITTDTSK